MNPQPAPGAHNQQQAQTHHLQQQQLSQNNASAMLPPLENLIDLYAVTANFAHSIQQVLLSNGQCLSSPRPTDKFLQRTHGRAGLLIVCSCPSTSPTLHTKTNMLRWRRGSSRSRLKRSNHPSEATWRPFLQLTMQFHVRTNNICSEEI